jgi:hypothetical protein
MCTITKIDRKSPPRATTILPVTTMEELAVLSDEERSELLAALKEAKAQVRSGGYTDYDPESLKKRLLDIYRNRKR